MNRGGTSHLFHLLRESELMALRERERAMEAELEARRLEEKVWAALQRHVARGAKCATRAWDERVDAMRTPFLASHFTEGTARGVLSRSSHGASG